MAIETPEWVIMLYLSGDNNLSPEMVRAINELGAVGSPERVAITIQFDPVARGVPPMRFVLKPGERLARATFEEEAAVGRQPAFIDENAANPETLARFIDWSLGQFRGGKRRMLVLSGHGSGAIGDFLTDDDSTSGQSSLSIPKLSKAFTTAQELLASNQHLSDSDREALYSKPLLQILGMDSCLMSMAEVAFQVQDWVEFLVASEGFVPEAGWPYALMLDRLRWRVCERKQMEPEAISAAIVRDYLLFYRAYISAGISVDMAAFDLRRNLREADDKGVPTISSRLDKLVEALKALVVKLGTLNNADVRDAVILAHWQSQSFKLEQYTDLWDFCNLVRERLRRDVSKTADEICQACEQVQRTINRLVGRPDQEGIAHGAVVGDGGRQGVEGVDFQHAHGVSVYFPWALPIHLLPSFEHGRLTVVEGDPLYPGLTPYTRLPFAAKSGWGEFLAKYLHATMRERRVHPAVNVELAIEASDGPRDTLAELALLVPDTVRFAPDAGKFAPDAGKFAPDAGKFAPDAGKFAPDAGKFAPDAGKFAPDAGKFAPDAGKFLSSLFGAGLLGNTKNPPQQAPLSFAHTGGGVETASYTG